MTALEDLAPNAALVQELEPVVAQELERHLETAKEWFPHEYVPWTEGTNFDGPYEGDPWDVAQSAIDGPARTALVVNLLTEDNLPSYHRAIAETVGRDSAWGHWLNRWTAEEARHSIAMRDYMLVTRAVDPAALERERMDHMSRGYATDLEGHVLTTIGYVSFQELATRISHRNAGRYAGEPQLERLLARIAADENLHMLMYRNTVNAAFELNPDAAMTAVLDVVSTFQMPGNEVEGFTRRSVQIAMAGIYDLRIHHDEVVQPILRAWRVFEREDLGPVGEKAREQLADFLVELDASASRFEQKRAERAERQALAGRG